MRRSIFVCRFAASTSIKDIISYISKKPVNPNMEQVVRCYKYNSDKAREISTCQITPLEEYCCSLIVTSFLRYDRLVKELLPMANTCKQLLKICITCLFSTIMLVDLLSYLFGHNNLLQVLTSANLRRLAPISDTQQY